MRILVVEDEPSLADTVARGLRREGFAVDLAGDGGAALEKVEVHPYDVVVLDRDLPVVHGDDVCRHLVGTGGAPRILMLTAAASVVDLVGGLELGADDYLGKPFEFAELVARVRALGRRSAAAVPPTLVHGDLTVDTARRVVTRAGRFVDLTRKEFAVLQELLAARGAVLSAEDLLDRVWDEHIDPFTNTVRVTMMKLRRKLGEPPLIDTVVGVGYRIAEVDR